MPTRLSWTRRSLRSEDGTATVETVLWLPIFIFAFGLVFDASSMFFAEAEAMRAIQEGNRLASIGRLKSTGETETHIEALLANLSANATASSTISTSGVISTSVTIPPGDLAMLGFFSQLTKVELRVGASQMMEDFI